VNVLLFSDVLIGYKVIVCGLVEPICTISSELNSISLSIELYEDIGFE